jgi:hypothetical protein
MAEQIGRNWAKIAQFGGGGMNMIAQYHVNDFLGGTPVAKEYRRTLLAMPVQVFGAGQANTTASTSIYFKQYTFLDLERRGLIELKMGLGMAEYSHNMNYSAATAYVHQVWMLTELGSEVVQLLKGAAPQC